MKIPVRINIQLHEPRVNMVGIRSIKGDSDIADIIPWIGKSGSIFAWHSPTKKTTESTYMEWP